MLVFFAIDPNLIPWVKSSQALLGVRPSNLSELFKINDKMKVLQYIDTIRSGGKERQLVELLKGLSKLENVDNELIIMSENVHYSYLGDKNIKTNFLLRKSKKDMRIFTRLYRLCKEIKPDILHSWNSMCSIYSVPVVKLLGIKFVNGFLRDAPPNIPLFSLLRAKITFPFSDAIVANSSSGLKAYGVPSRKAYFVHNGFDMSRIANLPDSKKVRDKFGIESDKIVGMVGSFSDKKDYSTFLSAAQIILSKRNDITFLMIGDGINLNKCKKKVLPQHKSQIKFLGNKENVEEIVNIFDVGVLCSTEYGEGISNSIMEYMALGKPVVATNCRGNRELVVDGKTGFLVSLKNADELAMRITQILNEADLAAHFSIAGQKRIINEFSFEKMVQQYVALYSAILKN